MPNPLWVPGSSSANPSGRPKNSVRTIKGMVERFVRRNISPNRLQKMYAGLSARDQVDMLLQLLPYAIAKQTNDGISNEEVEKLYALVEKAIKQNENRAAI